MDALAFFQFDLALLPVDCVMDYSVYARLYMSTLIPIGLVALLLATAVPHAKCAVQRARAAPKRDRRVRGDHELTRNICDAHSTAALLVGFLAYPTAVSAIFRLLLRSPLRDVTSHMFPSSSTGPLRRAGLKASAWCAALVLE